MYEIRETGEYKAWLLALRDLKARTRIVARGIQLGQGNPGDVKPLREGVSEMRIDVGPGYRVYFSRKGKLLLLLLCGGDKTTQSRDIERALRLNRDWSSD